MITTYTSSVYNIYICVCASYDFLRRHLRPSNILLRVVCKQLLSTPEGIVQIINIINRQIVPLSCGKPNRIKVMFYFIKV